MSTGARPSFTRTRWREGYAVSDVDDFLDELAAGLPDQ
ncbi:DivIVA domain-containing protein [Janibacter hoylei]|nr:DivIVA domain-containing protein [Janibacter hoylei]MCT1618373.1 DivIVA domain-containing protein [Janibacter hoylei]MCT2293298.1 DivIVA domain-containing protein [Janibacter hoylei]